MAKNPDRTKRLTKKWTINSILLIGILTLIYFSGPKPAKPDFSRLSLPVITQDLAALEDSINKSEASHSIKPDNHARIVWHTPQVKTPYSIVYLHGNVASQEEGDPIHEAIAHRYGCNLYLSRLAHHGLNDSEPMLGITVEAWMQSALDAIAIGKQIGEKVIVMSTSTGSTLGLFLQAQFPELIYAHVMLSPNIDLYDPRSGILARPWGLYIARMITGSKYYGWKPPGLAQQYWYPAYRIEGLCALKSMVNHTMTSETFHKANEPVLMLYYFKDENEQDQIVSVERMREMFEQLGTPDSMKMELALTRAGTHIIGSDIFNSNLEELWPPLVSFFEETLHLRPVNDTDWNPFLDQRFSIN